MKKYLHTLFFFFLVAVLHAQPADFVPGFNTIFEDRFELDPIGDLPAKWSTSGDGEVVAIDNVPGKWFRISQPTAVSPELLKSLPENCTIEFDLYLKSTSGVAPIIRFGLTTLSDVSSGDVYRSHISVSLNHYNENGSIIYGKNIQDMGEKAFPLDGYVSRILHVSISINKTRLRVYLDDKKVVDLPKLMTPEYRHNFFIASSPIIPSPEEGVYFSNVRIAAGEADARSLLIKQLMEQGSAITNEIQYNPQTNELTPESQPLIDQLGQALQQNPDVNIQVNSIEEIPPGDPLVDASTGEVLESGAEIKLLKASLKKKADKIKNYLVNKFKVKAARIVSDVKVKAGQVAEKNKIAGKTKNLFTEFIKLDAAGNSLQQ